MGFRFKSLSEDHVDAITHTWTVAFFLILSLVMLVVPGVIPPGYDSKSRDFSETLKVNHLSSIPTFKANCWCPSQFEPSQTAYTNLVCGKAANQLLHGFEPKAATLFYEYNVYGRRNSFKVKPVSQNDTVNPKSSDGDKEYNPDNNNNNTTNKDESDGSNKDELRHSKPVLERIKDSSNNPCVLVLLMAIGLRLPCILCTMVARLFSHSFNLDQTLEAARKGDTMSKEDRMHLYQTLVKPVLSRQGKKRVMTNTGLFFLPKALTIITIVVEIVFLGTFHLPGTYQTKQHHVTTGRDKTTDYISQTQTSDTFLEQSKLAEELETQIFPCSFPIHQITNIHRYTVQCLFEKDSHQETLRSNTSSSFSSHDNEIHVNVITIVFVSLCCILVLQIINTVTWIFWLVPVTKHKSMDLQLLLLVARSKLSLYVAHELFQAIKDTMGNENSFN